MTIRLRTAPRWWTLGFAFVTLMVSLGILATRWGVVVASHPAYLVTLVVAATAAMVVGATSVLDRQRAAEPDRRQAPRWRRVVARSAAVIGVVALLAALLYLRPLAASDAAINAMAGGAGVTVTDSATRIELNPTVAARTTGLVFYPGALVDPRAYVPNLTPLAVAGYPVVILKLPYNIAFFDPGGATKTMDAEPQITRWVVGGHSLGGVVASSVAGGTDSRVRGLLLWASYPSSSIADRTALQVTSISGSNDGLATVAKVDDAKRLLPPDTEYVVIPGGTHAFFGDYGEQSGDGTAAVSRDVAQRQIQDASLALLQRVDAAPSA